MAYNSIVFLKFACLLLYFLCQAMTAQAASLSNDPQVGSQDHISGTMGQIIGLPDVWDAVTSSPVIVAVIDTGVDYMHKDLATNMWKNSGEIPGNGIDDDDNGYVDDVYGYDFWPSSLHPSDPKDDYGHGTNVAGIIGEVGNNGEGGSGILWNVKIMALRSTDQSGAGKASTATEAINYAVANGARIINMSFVLSGAESAHSKNMKETIIDYAQSGIVFVASAGNEGKELPGPADALNQSVFDEIIIVGATDAQGGLWTNSNYGAQAVHLFAPGQSIYSTSPDNEYASWSGTSQAAPIVSAAAAMLLSLDSKLGAGEVKNLLLNSVTYKDAFAGKAETGGILNIKKAVELLTGAELSASVAEGSSQSDGGGMGGCQLIRH